MRGIRALVALGRDGRAHFIKHGPAGFFIRHNNHWNQPHCCMTMPGENDFVPGLGAPYQFCQLAFCISYGYLHG